MDKAAYKTMLSAKDDTWIVSRCQIIAEVRAYNNDRLRKQRMELELSLCAAELRRRHGGK